MTQKTRWLLVPLLLLTLALPTAYAEETVVRAVLFYSETCPHCQAVLNETLPPLQDKYGDQLEVLAIEVTDGVGYELWMTAMVGTTSEQLGQFINRRAAAVKLTTAGLFLLLAGWLVVSLV